MNSLLIAGQMIGSLAFDCVGLLCLATRDISIARIIDAVLAMVGTLLVNYGDRIKLA